MRTRTKNETIAALWDVSRRISECKDNHFFIGKNGEILGHGYLQGNGDYFVKYPVGMKMDIVVLKGMKKKDIIEQIRTTMNEE